MSKPQNFRTSMHGFNRVDVVNYIDYLVNRHNSEMDAVKADNKLREEELQEHCEALEATVSALRADPANPEQLELLKQEHQAELEQTEKLYQAQIDALKSEIEALKSALAEKSEAELEAYRRAERVETMTRDRANRQREKGDAILAGAGEQVAAMAQSMEAAASGLEAVIAQMRDCVSESKAQIASAAQALSALQAEE